MTQTKKSVKVDIYTIDIKIDKDNMNVSVWDTTSLTAAQMPQYVGEINFKLVKKNSRKL